MSAAALCFLAHYSKMTLSVVFKKDWEREDLHLHLHLPPSPSPLSLSVLGAAGVGDGREGGRRVNGETYWWADCGILQVATVSLSIVH